MWMSVRYLLSRIKYHAVVVTRIQFYVVLSVQDTDPCRNFCPGSSSMWYFLFRLQFNEVLPVQDTVEGGTARGTTALVYLQLHISLYTGTVHVLSRVAGVHPTSPTAD